MLAISYLYALGLRHYQDHYWADKYHKTERFKWLPLADSGDWSAYFDGDDPRIIVVDLSNLSFHIICENFNEWLAKAEQDYW